MFEVLHRDGWGRLGSWAKDGFSRKVSTPTIASYDSKRFPPWKGAPLIMTKSSDDVETPTIVSQGSLYDPKKAEMTPSTFAILPATLHHPLTFPIPLKDDHRKEFKGHNAFNIDGSSIPFDDQDILDKELIVLSNVDAFAQNPKVFASLVSTVRENIGYQRLLYAPGLGEPADLALLCYMGIDLFDETPLLSGARKGDYLTTDGTLKEEELKRGDMRPCPCPVCSLDKTLDYGSLLEHNRNVAKAELSNVILAIAAGRLRELVEVRASTSPQRMTLLRALDTNHYDLFETHTPIRRLQRLDATTAEALMRPEIVRFRRRFIERYRPPDGPKVLLLLPCSSRRPCSSSPSHRKFKEVIRSTSNPSLIHEVMVTSPLGIVPRELECFYPAMHYDIPVIGQWYPQEREMILEQLSHLIDVGTYSKVICHLGSDSDFLFDAFSEMERTSNGPPTSPASLGCLKENLDSALYKVDTNKKHKRKVEDLKSLTRFQFTAAAQRLFDNAFIAGSRHNRKIFAGKALLATLSSNKGTLSLTLEGGRILAEVGIYRVHIEDFHLKGNLFAIGVEGCDPEIRIGDDVVVVHGEEVRGVGRADMSPKEMVKSKRGKAVDIRHYVKGE